MTSRISGNTPWTTCFYTSQTPFGIDIPQGRGCLRPDYPFLAILTLPGPGPLPEDGLWYLWCLAALYYFPIEVNLEQMIAHLQDVKNENPSMGIPLMVR
ncbi:UNVERIFIED_CONTAM: hypothetical protein Slati_3105300 [Sesamum latifolium]|uniref:Uncharacterized protein n=1 Tax=Sesamum latifolium TaxID=2727402 RepID=A0AAW2UVP3_9LAMI